MRDPAWLSPILSGTARALLPTMSLRMLRVFRILRDRLFDLPIGAAGHTMSLGWQQEAQEELGAVAPGKLVVGRADVVEVAQGDVAGDAARGVGTLPPERDELIA